MDQVSLAAESAGGEERARGFRDYLSSIDSELSNPLVLADGDRSGKIIAPFCHGFAGLLSATDDDGTFAFRGRRLTVFSNEEELGGGTGENTPWLVEDALKDKGAII